MSKILRIFSKDAHMDRVAVTTQKTLQREEGFMYGWIQKFKSLNKLSDRKITDNVTKKMVDNEPDRYIAAADFVNNVKELIAVFGPDCLKKVKVCVQSISKMTHSYTIMPTIDATGKLLSPLFIVMQEISGDFGPLVKKDLFTAPNIYVTASRSGKMMKDHLKTWLKEVYFPHVGDRTVLLIDSWSTYKNQALLNNATPEDGRLICQHSGGHVSPLSQIQTARRQTGAFEFRDWKILYGKDSGVCVAYLGNVTIQCSVKVLPKRTNKPNQNRGISKIDLSVSEMSYSKFQPSRQRFIDPKPGLGSTNVRAEERENDFVHNMRLATSGHSYADNEVSISARAAQLGLLTPVTVLLSEKEPIVLAKRENIRFLPDGEDGQVLNEDDEMVNADAEDPIDDDSEEETAILRSNDF
ncbi:hypothetical protein BV898_19374 [Hypsibius exemplaris]|uniref:DDE-1 domain-containing protein n=1 Tax=Hypsibius exemplaris TaxID=2072580 RepID=A0A9X6NIX9_HYPEX|nr:hypothetical protein BV898_19374 [Hypsibius exemplaris]